MPILIRYQKRRVEENTAGTRHKIAFFQHERLVHLIVTVTFAILTMMSIIASIMISNPMLLVLTLLFLVLLVPYIMHYYTLENEVQKMYTQYDEILKHLS